MTGTPATLSAQGDPRSRDLAALMLPADPSEASAGVSRATFCADTSFGTPGGTCRALSMVNLEHAHILPFVRID